MSHHEVILQGKVQSFRRTDSDLREGEVSHRVGGDGGGEIFEKYGDDLENIVGINLETSAMFLFLGCLLHCSSIFLFLYLSAHMGGSGMPIDVVCFSCGHVAPRVSSHTVCCHFF